MTKILCDCTGSPPWSAMRRLRGRGPNRYYLRPECGTVREDVYREGAIIAHQWHKAPDDALPETVKEEALEILEAPGGEQVGLWQE